MQVVLALVLVLTLINTLAIAALVALKIRAIGVKKVWKPSTELADFLADIKTHDYAVLRLEPNRLMYRGVK